MAHEGVPVLLWIFADVSGDVLHDRFPSGVSGEERQVETEGEVHTSTLKRCGIVFVFVLQFLCSIPKKTVLPIAWRIRLRFFMNLVRVCACGSW